MLAVFHKKVFKGFWQKLADDENWLERTARALALNPSELEVYKCPDQRTDASFTFKEIDGVMNLIKLETVTQEVDGEMTSVVISLPPQPLEKALL
jgi:hypothetical protein